MPDNPSSRVEAPSVWAVGQTHPRRQRGHRYAKTSGTHPAKMFPAIARHAVAAYSRPGDTVLDPMCGIGTTLVEAVHLGRHAVGVEYEPEWAAVASANAYLARRAHDAVECTVLQGDARRLADVITPQRHGQVDLIVTSPPYGAGTHGRAHTARETGGAVAKTQWRYSPHQGDAAQLAHAPLARLLGSLTEIFAGCAAVLKPGGIMVAAARPWTQNGGLVAFPEMLASAAADADFVPRERGAALLARWDQHTHTLTAHHSFFRLHNTRLARDKGLPVCLTVHEDILVFGLRTTPTGTD